MGISERKEREREARRNAILDAAEAVFKSKGFANATMDDIAREAELAKGTVYLYYKSKEELQVGLVMRGLDLMKEAMELRMKDCPTAFDKIIATGEAYWDFAIQRPFYFSVMNMMDGPHKSGQVSEESCSSLHERSSDVWKMLIQLLEDSKREGFVKQEVNSFAFAMLLWMNATALLRFQDKVQNMPDSVWRNRKNYNVCDVNFKVMYSLNGGLLFREIVTPKGAEHLGPITWPTEEQVPSRPCDPEQRSFHLSPFATDAIESIAFEPRL